MKILLLIAAVLIFFVASVYIFIPNKIIISEKVTVAASREALFRTLSDSAEWENWWPAKEAINLTNHPLLLNGLQYQLTGKKAFSLPLSISGKNFKAYNEFTFITINTDTTVINLDGIVITSYNPIKRIRLYFAANKVKKDISSLLQRINAYYSKTENLYGYPIEKKSVVDSVLISTFTEMKSYPSTAAIYTLIDELKNYIKQQGANETGYPMLNILKTDSANYRVRVALPVDKKLPPSGNISYKWMMGGGNILITEVHGGNDEIQKALGQVQNYISDYKRTAPAISFQSLITDRRKEPDSSKWVTKIYYPVM